MTDAPWRRDFDNARDPYTARNALGILSTSSGGGSGFITAVVPPLQVTGTTLSIDLSAYLTSATAAATYQPLDGDLTAIAALTGTNVIYYRSAANTWTAVTIGANLTFTGGTLAATGGGSGDVISVPTPVAGQAAVWTDATHIQGASLLRLGLGSEAVPTYSFSGNTGSGMFSSTIASDLIFSVNGNTKLTLTPSTGAFISGPLTVSGTLTASSSIRNADGAVGSPSYTFTSDPTTGFWFGAANLVNLSGALTATGALNAGGDIIATRASTTTRIQARRTTTGAADVSMLATNSLGMIGTDNAVPLALYTSGTGSERGRITTTGALQWGNTIDNPAETGAAGIALTSVGTLSVSSASNPTFRFGRTGTGAGNFVNWYQGATSVAAISVDAGGVVTYGAFLGSHWARLEAPQDLPRGTVLEAVDELVAWPNETNDRLPMVKVSDTPGSKAIYGTYFGPDASDDFGDIFVAGVGLGHVRMQPGAVVTVGDLVESAGDGCARRQADDVIRSCTLGKVMGTAPSETYADGSYVLPCVLYCG